MVAEGEACQPADPAMIQSQKQPLNSDRSVGAVVVADHFGIEYQLDGVVAETMSQKTTQIATPDMDC